ncbi:MAG TPA: SUMF1/EgtB/PvdO family nonheme iron enzyme, partial [Anaerolineales bacterium]|nr:SUMF1/EgtB/PvdO family nonheme iron enzyme [Anaerolineales bacterium]
VADWYSDNYYRDASLANPVGPISGDYRVIRGGAWYVRDFYTRTTVRGYYGPDGATSGIGFRCAMSAFE